MQGVRVASRSRRDVGCSESPPVLHGVIGSGLVACILISRCQKRCHACDLRRRGSTSPSRLAAGGRSVPKAAPASARPRTRLRSRAGTRDKVPRVLGARRPPPRHVPSRLRLPVPESTGKQGRLFWSSKGCGKSPAPMWGWSSSGNSGVLAEDADVLVPLRCPCRLQK